LNEILARESGSARSPVVKALKLLAHLAANKDAVALADLSRALKLPKPTTYRLARSIETTGFVHKDPLTRRYRVGTAFEDLALSALRYGAGHAPRQLLMNDLAELLGARVNLVILRAGSVTNVEWVESTAALRVDIRSNLPMAVHSSASGKLLLAFGSNDLQEHFLRSAPFEAYTKKTITSRRAFMRELENIRERGYAQDDEELIIGVNCLAVPIRNGSGEVVAGLAVMAATASLPLDKLRGHLKAIQNCAALISADLGSRPAAATNKVISKPHSKKEKDSGSIKKSVRAARKPSRERTARTSVNSRRPEV